MEINCQSDPFKLASTFLRVREMRMCRAADKKMASASAEKAARDLMFNCRYKSSAVKLKKQTLPPFRQINAHSARKYINGR